MRPYQVTELWNTWSENWYNLKEEERILELNCRTTPPFSVTDRNSRQEKNKENWENVINEQDLAHKYTSSTQWQ